MSSSSRRVRAPETQSQKGPDPQGKRPQGSGLSHLESTQMKQEIAKRSQKISELIQKHPEKAAKILAEWINSAHSAQSNTKSPPLFPSKGTLRRKPG